MDERPNFLNFNLNLIRPKVLLKHKQKIPDTKRERLVLPQRHAQTLPFSPIRVLFRLKTRGLSVRSRHKCAIIIRTICPQNFFAASKNKMPYSDSWVPNVKLKWSCFSSTFGRQTDLYFNLLCTCFSLINWKLELQILWKKCLKDNKQRSIETSYFGMQLQLRGLESISPTVMKISYPQN